ncbi:hypothetical protein ScPMuIL_016887 [Solemya velum]
MHVHFVTQWRYDIGTEWRYDIGTGWHYDIGTGWRYNIGTGWRYDIGTGWRYDIGTGWRYDIGTGWRYDIGTGWRYDIGTGWRYDIGTGWRYDIGTGWRYDIGTGWRYDIGTGWRYDIGTGWRYDIGTGWRYDIGTGWRYDIGTGWRYDIGTGWRYDIGTGWRYDIGTGWRYDIGTGWRYDIGTGWCYDIGTRWRYDIGTGCVPNLIPGSNTAVIRSGRDKQTPLVSLNVGRMASKVQPKYNFGLLETPVTISALSSGESSSVNITSGRSNYQSTSSSTSNYRSSSRVPTSRCMSANLKTPAMGQNSTRSNLKTPGSRRTPYTTSSATPGDPNSSVIVAIVEGRGLAKGEVGMASLDLKSPILTLSQFSDTTTYVKTITKLQILQPLEIILPNTACENGTMTKLFKLLNDQYQHTNISTVQRKYFNETKGLQYVKQLCVAEYNTVEMEVASRYYCLAAAAALMKYVEFIQNVVFAPASMKIVFKGSEHTTMIDAVTARNLELLQNLRDPKSDHSLFGILNFTKTAGGCRLLRANILQPPSDTETIMMRQGVVSELTEKEEIFYNLQSVIDRFLDISHLLSLCVQIPKQETVKTAESKISSIIYLKHVLELIEPLREALRDFENPLMKAYYRSLEDPRFCLIMSKISSVINEDTRYKKGALNMRTQKCFAVKVSLLDVARRTHTEIVDDITDLVKQLAEKHSLPLKATYNTARGFYIQLYSVGKEAPSADDLPGIFIKVTKYKSTYSFTTTDLIKLNDRIKESLQEIYLMTNIVVTELLNDIRDQIGCLYKLTECVSMLDMLVAFAHACTLGNYVKPEFTDTLAIKLGRHPILEKIAADSPVPNNTYASEDSNFLIITGPNMVRWKSTYLRQICLLQIMAQIGAFVPAEYASFRIADQIFSRIGSDDDMETNSSTFMLEMKEINYIIQNASDNSFIIVDELGRGTSTDEGIGICHAVCEYLLNLKAFTFFVTHFLDLTNLDSLYPNAENYYFEIQRSFSTDGNCEKVYYTHSLSKGRTEERYYGLQLAEVSTMPRAVIEKARELTAKITENKKKNQQMEGELARQRAVFKLANKLIQVARNSRLDDESLKLYLKSLKFQHEEDLIRVEE